MSVALIPNPPESWDVYQAGPFVGNTILTADFGGALAGFATPAYSPNTFALNTPRQVFTFGSGGTGVTTVRGYHRGTLCLIKRTTSAPAIDGLGGVNIWPQIDQTGLPAGYRNPSFRRVQWFTVCLAMDAGLLTGQSGFLMVGSGGGASQIWPLAPAPGFGVGYGIVGDGAGNWNWESYGGNAVPGTLIESVSLAPAIADPSDFHVFDFVHVSATASRQASFQLRIDGQLFLERTWGAPPALEVPATGARRYYPQWQVNDALGQNHYLAWWEYKMGRFLPDGRELFD